MLNISLGKTGEVVAGKFLTAKGFKIIAQNYKCLIGEIDLIAVYREKLYFIEVKTRAGLSHGFPAEAVTPKKQAKLRKLALYYLANYPYTGPVAFGVVEVLYNSLTRHYQVNWIADAF